jgi:hypothetical protein
MTTQKEKKEKKFKKVGTFPSSDRNQGQKQCCGSELVSSMRIRIQLLTSMQIRIQIHEAKLMRIRILVRLCRYKKFNFYVKNIGTSVGNRPTWVKKPFERLKFRFTC